MIVWFNFEILLAIIVTEMKVISLIPICMNGLFLTKAVYFYGCNNTNTIIYTYKPIPGKE